MTAADKEFFDTIDTGTVPVIAIFTKFDALDAAAFSALSEQGVPFADAQRQAPEHAQVQFDQNLLPLIMQLAHPPKAVVCLRNMHHIGSPATNQKAAAELIESTGAALDDGALKVLLVQAQCVNMEICMKAAVDSGIITRTAQDALQEDTATFNPLKKKLIKQLFGWFPFIWSYDNLTTAANVGITGTNFLGYYVSSFIDTITPLVHSSLYSMPPPLQILAVGCAVIIVTVKAFWKGSPGYIWSDHIIASSQDYIQSNTAEHVRVAILEAFQDTPGLYDTPEGKAALLQVILNNQMSIGD